MEKKILGLIVSPRKHGNSELAARHIIDNIPGPKSTEFIRLTDLIIKPCRTCYRCLQAGQECTIDDDFNELINKINMASAIVFAVPVYILGPHSMYKVLCDRLMPSFHYAQYNRDKPCIIVTPYGSKGWIGFSQASSIVLPRMLQMKIIDVWQPFATLPGEVFQDPANLAYAENLGRNIFTAPEYQPKANACNLCGSDIIRLIKDDIIECPICGAQGKLLPGNRPDFSGSPYYRFSEKEMAHHYEWLGEMKESFFKKRSELKTIQNSIINK